MNNILQITTENREVAIHEDEQRNSRRWTALIRRWTALIQL